MMFETLIGLTFLFALWVFGRSLILACSANGSDWLAMPIGLCFVGLSGNVLYFAAGLSVQIIQLMLLFALLPCLALVLSRGARRSEWIRLLAVCGIFLVLALPAYIGGEQYYVFRGNHWDHFNYIDQALTLRDNPYSAYQNASANKFLAKDILVHGMTFISQRPAVGLVFALLLPTGLGNIHLLAFLYMTALWALVFPAACFAWQRILPAYETSASGPLLLVVPPLAYVVGFWGQYIFDINAWSQMASLSLQLAFVFAYLRLLQKLADPPTREGQSITSDYVVTGLLAAGAFLFYPENAVIQSLLLLVATILWCAVTRKIPRLTAVVSLAVFSVAALLISSIPNWDATVGFVIGQIKFGAAHAPDHWWTYFDSYWRGLHANAQGGAGSISVLANLVLASTGMFFLTPDYSVPLGVRHSWIAVTVILALLTLYSLAVTLATRFRANGTAIFLKAFVLASIPLFFYFLTKNALWSLGKLLSFLSPYIFIALCLPIVESAKIPATSLIRSKALGEILTSGFVILFVMSQIAFGAARIWTARDPYGIGYGNSTYPSIQVTTMKTTYLWDMEPSVYSHCKGVHLYNDTDPFYMEYMKQKLTYLGVPYFSSLPVKTHYGGGHEVGRQQPIVTDCNAVFMKGSSGKWRAVSMSKLPPFDGAIDPAHRHPLIGFVGISGPEAWGSWTDGERARIVLPQSLPDRFTLELDIMSIFGPNVGKPFRIRAGGQERIITFTEPGIYSVAFQDVKDASDFEILVPAPTSPQSLGLSSDTRALGLGLKRLRILPMAPITTN